MFPDYYKILGLKQSATREDIKKAYRKLALEFHPDVNKSPDAHQKFIEINEAYLILYDEEARAKYDIEYNYIYSEGKEKYHDEYEYSNNSHERQQANQEKTKQKGPFKDYDLNDWAKKAKNQGAEYAQMAFEDFSSMVVGLVKETGFQLGNTLLVFFGLILTISGFGNIIIGLISGSEIGNPIFGIVMLPAGILLWRAANKNWEKH
jgi:curved DNA-binding protein CbpA